MSDFNASISDQVVAVCNECADETADALTRTFDTETKFSVGEAGVVDVEAFPEGCDGPGLMFSLVVESVAALVMLPESSGLLPDWYRDPDITEKSKLATLAQELGMLLIPEDFMPMDFRAEHVDNLAESAMRAAVENGAGLVPLTLTMGEKSGQATLVWPATSPSRVFIPKPVETPPAAEQSPSEPQAAAAQPAPPTGTSDPQHHHTNLAFEDGLGRLPGYTRSLLKIEVPIIVSLAVKRQPIGRILELGPGSIIQFDKSCEETLNLEVNNRTIASGEAVKVGEKFGLRVTNIIMPDERFVSIGSKEPQKA